MDTDYRFSIWDPSIKLLYFPVKAIFKDILLLKKKKEQI